MSNKLTSQQFNDTYEEELLFDGPKVNLAPVKRYAIG
jgi:hypothetical protein